MSSVYFDPAVGGDGSTVTDDNNASTGLGNGGHRTRFVPALAQVVSVSGHVVAQTGSDVTATAASASAAASSASAAATSASNASTSASNASTSAGAASTSASAAAGSASSASTSASSASSSATSASTSASNAATSAIAAAGSASSASTSASNAAASESGAAGSATTASNAATTALNAPGTSASSTTSLTIGTGSKALTIQPAKSIVVGMSVVIAATSTPTDRMSGVVTAYDGGTGALSVQVDVANGIGNSYAGWTVILGNAVPDAATQAEMEAGTEASLRSVSPLRIKQAITATASLLGHTHTGTYEPVQTAATEAEMVSGTVSDVRSMSPLRVKQAMVVGYVARTANAMLAVGDFGKFIDITSGTFTQTFTAATTLGEGWWCYLRNAGTGVITVDPNASETIDGVTSGVIVAGDTYLILCTGTSFITERRQNGPMRIELKTSSGSWTAPLGVYAARVSATGGGAGAKSEARYVGGGGGTAIKTFKVQPGTVYNYVVGAAGTIGYSGTNGGASTFTAGGVTITGGGGQCDNSSAGYIGKGGAATGGDINISGGAGLPASASDTENAGGDSVYGFGARKIGDSNNTALYVTATGYGGGACGDSYGNATATQGCVIIEY